VNRAVVHRALLWAALLLFAAWFLTPLYVMVTTSLKDMQQVRDGHLLSLPTAPTLAAWAKAWSGACTGIDCGGLKPFFVNSILMVLPAVAVSTAIGSARFFSPSLPAQGRCGCSIPAAPCHPWCWCRTART